MEQIAKEKQERVNRVFQKLKDILDAENCELEPFLLIVNGTIVKKEINIITKDITPTPEVQGGAN